MHWAVLIVTILCVNFGSCRDTCATSENLLKYVEELNHLTSQDIILEAKFGSHSKNNYRFTVTHSWNVNNGDLDYGDTIYINIDDTEDTFQKCFDEIVQKERYFLLIKKHENSNTFTAKLIPLPLKKRSSRERVWNTICTLPSINCGMSISRKLLPSVVQLFPSMNNLLRCVVKSRSRLAEIRWFKDGRDIEKYGGDTYAANGLIVRDINLRAGTRDLIIFDAHKMHSGIYSCTARNVDGETTTLETRLSVGSLSEAFVPCPSSANNYCQNGAQCKAVRGLPNELVCECKSGYKGARCQEPEFPEIRQVKTEQELSKEVSELRIVVIILGCCLAGSLLCLIIIAFMRMKKTLPSVIRIKRDINFSEEKELESPIQQNKLESSLDPEQNNSPTRGQRQRLTGFHV